MDDMEKRSNCQYIVSVSVNHTYISKFAAYEPLYLLVTKGELERLKKRFMKLDAWVLLAVSVSVTHNTANMDIYVLFATIGTAQARSTVKSSSRSRRSRRTRLRRE
jgi:hypothetical protein